ncbi:MAG: DUF4118 domain-containing protein [Propionibacteriaceae bacterium]|jgi:two-component system sensor histidine kinase KdpD|nr:DUF4118 domain-containing protein [Propionibacteriaceae bacterium]
MTQIDRTGPIRSADARTARGDWREALSVRRDRSALDEFRTESSSAKQTSSGQSDLAGTRGETRAVAVDRAGDDRVGGDTPEAGETPRGALTIFFGYAAGVGKTYAMLTEAHEKARAGIDVVVGYVEPHTRPETQRLVDGLTCLEPKTVAYRDIELKEFDVDAALARHPKMILVDELAHTNAPGSRNKKRYQDVEELLRAGIDVSTTLNVQHLESLNNVVAGVTNTPVRETVPDYVFDRADKVKIIDLEPDDLLTRLAEGKIYHGERVSVATEHFFTRENLRALREIAIREAADRISHETGGSGPQRSVEPKIVVCVGPSAGSGTCVRWTARMAQALFADWVAVYVEDQDQDGLSAEAHQAKRANIDLAQKLGAEVVTLSGVDPVVVLAEYVKASGARTVVVGQSAQVGWRRTFAERLIRLVPGVQLHLVPTDAEGAARDEERPRRVRSLPLSGADGLKTLGLLTAATVVSEGLVRLGVGDQNLIMVYLLCVLVVSRVTRGYVWGVVASVVGVVLFNFLFVVPSMTLSAVAPGYPITFLIMLGVALITSGVTNRVKTQARLAVKRERRTELLYEISRQLVGTEGRDGIIDLTNQHVVRLFGRSVAFYSYGDDEPRVLAAPGDPVGFLLAPDERAVAQWVFVNQKMAGSGTDTLMGAGALYLPVVSRGVSFGVIAVSAQLSRPSTYSRFFLQTIVSEVALAMERQALADERRGGRRYEGGVGEGARGGAEQAGQLGDLSADQDTYVVGSTEVIKETARDQGPGRRSEAGRT